MTNEADRERRLQTLERLLELPALDLKTALDRASSLIAEAVKADKVDAWLHDPTKESLRALGTSDTPLGRRQLALGLDRLPLANGGTIVEVFKTGEPRLIEHMDQVADEVPGIAGALGIRSQVGVPLDVADQRRGVLAVQSREPAFFTEVELRFLSAVARWLGAVVHRAELVETLAAGAREAGRNSAAEELVTVLAHDLRNHLVPLRGRLGVIRKRAQREGRSDEARDADLCDRSVARLARLVSDLLDVGRIEQGLFMLVPEPIDLVRIAQETAQALASSDVAVRVEAPAELLAAADPERFRQALENLVSNAVQHSPKGTEVLVALSIAETEGAEHAVVQVTDEGPGIPEDVLPRVFERFTRGTKSSGLGLGLYLAKQIATAHGGDLTVVSRPERGVTFRLTLPVASPKAPRD
ncbi:Chemotaxis regulator - transmits chemoreceptor signals to flagelllar motor components CheY [Minicystis rosea]|nr:Chemotaxis regulator - transmits chemoreceptor signals to flagelllar motor components CheY [Minicystis rosea]